MPEFSDDFGGIAERMEYLVEMPISLAILAFIMQGEAPRQYAARRAEGIVIDGKLDDAAWKNAPWTDLFVDIEGSVKPAPRFATRAKMLWDDDYFIGAELAEPDVWATLTEHVQ